MGKELVSCSNCGEALYRYLINPKGVVKSSFFCDKHCKGVWQKSQREALGFTREWLEHEYLVLGKGSNQIGREIGRDGKRVWEWLRDYGIVTRGRGQDPTVQFKKGRPSPTKGKPILEHVRQAVINRQRTNPSLKGRFGKDHPRFGKRPKNWKGGLSPERQKIYGTQDWKNAVKEVWKRDDAICQKCGLDHRTIERRNPIFDIHHIVGFEVEHLRCDPSNLVLLCRPCHMFVHSSKNTNREFLA